MAHKGEFRRMPGSTFQTNTYDLDDLLKDCHTGVIQLPEFQRGWVWDEDRIKSLIASISQAFPVGALMSLDTGGPVKFKLRPIEGAPEKAKLAIPQSLLLDGQLRMTSLYQATLQHRQSLLHRLRHCRRSLRADDAAPQRDLRRDAGAAARPRSRGVACPDRQSLENKFFGFEPVGVLGYKVMISDREKTAIDCIDRPALAGGGSSC